MTVVGRLLTTLDHVHLSVVNNRPMTTCIALDHGARPVAKFSKFRVFDKVPQRNTLIFEDIPISLKTAWDK